MLYGYLSLAALAVEPLLLGCGVKPHDLKRLEHQPKQIIHGCPVNPPFEAAWVLAALVQPNHIVPLCSRISLTCRLHARSNVLGIRKFGIYCERNNLVGRGWEMQEGLAVEPLLLGCGVKPHDLKRLEHQPKQIIHGCPVNPL